MENLHGLFCDQAKLTPQATALVDKERNLTYWELDDLSDQLAGFLRKQGIHFDMPVGIFMDKCVEYVVSCIAILKAGGAFLPLDVTHPEGFLNKILDETRPSVIITKDPYQVRLNKSISSSNILNIDNDSMWKIGVYDRSKVTGLSPDNLAYIVMSSGTTGEPKGILGTHRGAVHSYLQRYEVSSYKPGDRVACNIFFVWEVLRPLLKGATCYIIPDDVMANPKALLNFIKENQITEILFTPSLLESILNSLERDFIGSKLSSLKVLWLNGEVVTSKLKTRALEALPEHVRLLNTYSISECHDISSHDLRNDKNQESKFCPVGYPIKDVEIKLLDEKMCPVEPGEVGELYVAGPCLARGYLNRPELTAERFVNIQGKRFYRTGDLARIDNDGKLEIQGRCDFMVKIRGYSISLGAIESALLEHADVESCAVIAEGEEGEDKRLVAYVVPKKHAGWKVDRTTGACREIRRRLKPYLPHYMIPSAFVQMESLPINPATGKLDRNLLPSSLSCQSYKHARGGIKLQQGASDDDKKATMRSLWESILSLEKGSVSDNDNFFDLGGHSLLAIELTLYIENIFGVELSVKDIYEYPTVDGLVYRLNYQTKAKTEEISIKDDAYLISEIRPATQSKPLSLGDAKSVLLTGATGFLGAFLLHKLLSHTKKEVKIYCVVRTKSGNSDDAFLRIRHNLQSYNLWQKEMEERIVPVMGDLSQKQLGLPFKLYNQLAEEIDFIFHCAAIVNYAYSYSIIKPHTINGIQEILRLAATQSTKPIFYLSTIGIFPGGEHTKYFENSDIDHYADQLNTGYQASKWVAEKMMWEAVSRGFPVCIFRPGNIGPDSQSGIGNPNDFQSLIIDACIKVGCAPLTQEWNMEMTPVDFLSEAIVQFSESPAHFGRVYHSVNPRLVPAEMLFNLMLDSSCISRLVPLDQWMDLLSVHSRKNNDWTLKIITELLPDWEKYLTEGCIYDCSCFEEALSFHGLRYPELGYDYFRKLLQWKMTSAISDQDNPLVFLNNEKHRPKELAA